RPARCDGIGAAGRPPLPLRAEGSPAVSDSGGSDRSPRPDRSDAAAGRIQRAERVGPDATVRAGFPAALGGPVRRAGTPHVVGTVAQRVGRAVRAVRVTAG